MSIMCSRTVLVGLVAGTIVGVASLGLASGTPEQKCEGGKADALGKYSACVAKAEKGLVTGGDPVRYGEALAKCEDKLAATWAKLEAAAVSAGSSCPTTGDQAAAQGFLDACLASAAGLVGGAPLPVDVVTCNTDLATCDAGLATCGADLAGCGADLTDCGTDLVVANAAIEVLEGEMRCPLGGIGGSFTATLTLPNPDPPAICASQITISGATVTATVSGCSNGVPGGVMTGTISGNVLTMAEQPNAACGGARGELTLVVDNTCDSTSGTFICRMGPGGGIFATTPVTTARD